MRHVVIDLAFSSLIGKNASVIAVGVTEIINGKQTDRFSFFPLSNDGPVYVKALEAYGLNQEDIAGAPKFSDVAPLIQKIVGSDSMIFNAPSQTHLTRALQDFADAGFDFDGIQVKCGSRAIHSAMTKSHASIRRYSDVVCPFACGGMEQSARKFTTQLELLENDFPGSLSKMPAEVCPARTPEHSPVLSKLPREQRKPDLVSFPIHSRSLLVLEPLKKLKLFKSGAAFLAHLQDHHIGIIPYERNDRIQGLKFVVSGLAVSDAGIGGSGFAKHLSGPNGKRFKAALLDYAERASRAGYCKQKSFLEKRRNRDGFTMTTERKNLPQGYVPFEADTALPAPRMWVARDARDQIKEVVDGTLSGCDVVPVEDVYSLLTAKEANFLIERYDLSPSLSEALDQDAEISTADVKTWILRGAPPKMFEAPENALTP